MSKWLCSDSPAAISDLVLDAIYSVRRHLKQSAEFTSPPPPLRCCSDVSRATTSDLTFFWPEAVSYVLVCGCPGSSFCAVRHCNLLARSSSLTLLVITSEVGNISTAAARLCGTRQSLVSDGRPISAPNGASAFNSAQLDGVVNSALLTCILFFFCLLPPDEPLLFIYIVDLIGQFEARSCILSGPGNIACQMSIIPYFITVFVGTG